MKSKIFMYLFFFTLLLLLFQYMNQKSIFENQSSKIESLTAKFTAQKDSIKVLNNTISDLDYFTLQGNDNAMTYIENLGLQAHEVEDYIREVIYEYNFNENGNPLIPLEGMYGKMRVNKVKFLNHRWILADFSDGKVWGEMILEYFYTQENKWELTPISSTLYPK